MKLPTFLIWILKEFHCQGCSFSKVISSGTNLAWKMYCSLHCEFAHPNLVGSIPIPVIKRVRFLSLCLNSGSPNQNFLIYTISGCQFDDFVFQYGVPYTKISDTILDINSLPICFCFLRGEKKTFLLVKFLPIIIFLVSLFHFEKDAFKYFKIARVNTSPLEAHFRFYKHDEVEIWRLFNVTLKNKVYFLTTGCLTLKCSFWNGSEG